MRRRFNSSERVALYVVAGGKCASCGAELEPGWHADHIEPYCRGGETDVLNGQALCPACNLAKGGSLLEAVGEWPTNLVPRKCQVEGADAFRDRCVVEHISSNFLAVMTPASGKTILALLIAHREFKKERIERLVVVVPSEQLKQQWADEACKVGIQLDPSRKNRDGIETSDFHGVAVTYQQVAKGAGLHRMGCGSKRTLVIFDEIHHAGEDKSWGKEIHYAFAPAEFRLLLSGTAWRSGNSPIPFVTYEDGISRADYTYGYARALVEGDNAYISFYSYDGEITWHGKSGDYFTKNLVDEVPEDEAARRLRTALDPNGQWLCGIIKQADDKLDEIRNSGDPRAAGLVVCPKQDDAKRIAELMAVITGEKPVVAISDDPEASKKIKTFREGKGKWIVAVKMVSEGVDIPRLRVGVYATNIITRLFFIQLCGRFTRINPELDKDQDQTAYLFIPSDVTLEEYAQEIKREQVHELREELKKQIDEGIERIRRAQLEFDLLLPGSSSDPALNKLIYEETSASAEELGAAHELRTANPLLKNVTDEQIITILRSAASGGVITNGAASGAAVQTPTQAPPIRRDTEIKAIRKEINRRAAHVANSIGAHPQDIHNMLISHSGKTAKDRSLKEHEECYAYLRKLLEDYG